MKKTLSTLLLKEKENNKQIYIHHDNWQLYKTFIPGCGSIFDFSLITNNNFLLSVDISSMQCQQSTNLQLIMHYISSQEFFAFNRQTNENKSNFTYICHVHQNTIVTINCGFKSTYTL